MFRMISDYSKLVDSQCSDRVCNNPIKQFDAKPFHSELSFKRANTCMFSLSSPLSVVSIAYVACSIVMRGVGSWAFLAAESRRNLTCSQSSSNSIRPQMFVILVRRVPTDHTRDHCASRIRTLDRK